jgi:hypothetical protein
MRKKKFLVIYLGTESAFEKAEWNKMDEAARKERQQAGMQAWEKWGTQHANAIVDQGTPVGKTKRVDRAGTSNIKNTITGYVIVEAESHEAAAKLFENHPHFSIFPGEGVEVMECLDLADVMAKAKS